MLIQKYLDIKLRTLEQEGEMIDAFKKQIYLEAICLNFVTSDDNNTFSFLTVF